MYLIGNASSIVHAHSPLCSCILLFLQSGSDVSVFHALYKMANPAEGFSAAPGPRKCIRPAASLDFRLSEAPSTCLQQSGLMQHVHCGSSLQCSSVHVVGGAAGAGAQVDFLVRAQLVLLALEATS